MKKLTLLFAVVLTFAILLTACGGKDNGNSSTPDTSSKPPLSGNVFEGGFYKIALPDGWSGDPGMYNVGGDFDKSLSIDAMDKIDGLDKEKAAEFLGVENLKDGDIVSVKVGGYDAFKYSNTEDAQQTIISYIFNAYDFTVMIYYNTDQLDSKVVTAIEAMEIFEKKDENGNGGDPNDILGNPDPVLIALIEKLYEGIDDVPMCESWELKADNFKQFLFIDYIEGSKGVASQAMIDSVPHVVVLLELPSGANTKAVASEIEANADPSKWICVNAEKVGVFHHENYVVMVMSSKSIVEGVKANVSTAFTDDDSGLDPL